jgi:drug/metabolite transporter (DMT)-like permease
MVLVRIVLVGGGQTIVYYCLTYMPVSTVITLLNLGPIFIFFVEAVAYRVSLLLSRNHSIVRV